MVVMVGSIREKVVAREAAITDGGGGIEDKTDQLTNRRRLLIDR
jgi:hypothetical protein